MATAYLHSFAFRPIEARIRYRGRGCLLQYNESAQACPVKNDFSGFAGSHRLKSLLELRCTETDGVMTGEMSTPDSSITVILYQVSYISRP